MTAKGVGLITIVSIISETNGFALIQNSRQLTSYAGYDIVQNQSGSHNGKTKISKKGNKYIRKACYMPVLSAIRFNKNLKTVYQRLCINKAVKSIALIAVARKILVLIYTLWKKNEEYNENYNFA